MTSRMSLISMEDALEAVTEGADIRFALCMSNETLDADMVDATAVNVDDCTLDESDDGGTYGRQAITTEATTMDDANNRVEFTDSGASSIVFGSGDALNGDATRDYTAILGLRHVTNDTDSIPLVAIDISVVKEATEVTVTWNAEGIIQVANAA